MTETNFSGVDSGEGVLEMSLNNTSVGLMSREILSYIPIENKEEHKAIMLLFSTFHHKFTVLVEDKKDKMGRHNWYAKEKEKQLDSIYLDILHQFRRSVSNEDLEYYLSTIAIEDIDMLLNAVVSWFKAPNAKIVKEQNDLNSERRFRKSSLWKKLQMISENTSIPDKDED